MAKSAKLKVVPKAKNFRDIAAKYRECDEKAKMFAKERDALKDDIKEFVLTNGTAFKESIEYIDDGVRWLLKSRVNYQDADGVDALQVAIKGARGSARQVLGACLTTRVVVDRDAWERAKALGHITDEVCAAYEGELIRSLNWSYVDKARCPQCDQVVTQSANFCSGCGSELK